LRRKFEAAHQEHLENLEKLRATFAELEKYNHPADLAWAREELRRVEAVHAVLTNAIRTGGHIDPEELSAFLSGGKGKR
jgi:hypothetical protein